MMLVPLQEVKIRDFSGFMKQPNCLCCVDGMPPNRLLGRHAALLLIMMVLL